jgi:hypothetical protein
MKRKAVPKNNKFKDHLAACRCCLKSFQIKDDKAKITEIIKKRFNELTQIKVDNNKNV